MNDKNGHAIDSISNVLIRMRQLAIQANNGTYSTHKTFNNKEKYIIKNKEFLELQKEIDDIAKNSKFNGISLLDGNQESTITLKIGKET